ncbi:MAG: ABC-type transport system involved in resistance to organic solvent, periplasmic component [Planctomycetota bacterium]|nr:ABC-type transport system involved in resistance to organic solvent, periplasmic component [Planctomycetota bacterium]
MSHEISRTRALLNAILALAVIAVAGFGATRVARRHWQGQKTFSARVEMAQVGGLELGGKVRVQGIDAGVVEAIIPPSLPGKPISLVLRIDEGLRHLVRSDATARITAQGVIGAKILEIVPGRPDATPLADGGSLRAEPTVEFADLLKDAASALKRIDSVARSAETGLGEITAIAAEIRAGRGTLGKLVRDDEAYQRLIAMSTRGEKALGDLDENLAALKRTWPISRYFNGRGFDDRDRVLFQPGSERESRTLLVDNLFEPGRAVLTSGGRKELDDVARWFFKFHRPKTTEVVIAAFTDDPLGDEDLAQALTQEQAEAVRRYLTKQHALDSTGWFSSRKIAAVGFGTQAPRTLAETGAVKGLPTRRVEIILFTPQV